MGTNLGRRDILRLFGVGGVVFASGLGGAACASSATPPRAGSPPPFPARGRGLESDFFFLQLSDTHWGYKGAANPEAELTLRQTVALVNSLSASARPDFVVFTGDLTHTTDDPKERRARMAQFKEIVSELEVKTLRMLPGEHDASLDRGEAFVEAFGSTHYAFDHKGVHFVALDNVSEASGILGDAQLEWLERDLASVAHETPVVVLTHRPLFDLYPAWEWSTHDGARALDILGKHSNVTVFYGHIHQEHHRTTGAIAHHAARSLIFPQPAPGSVAKRAPLSWNPESPDHGLGYRSVKLARGAPAPTWQEVPFREVAAPVATCGRTRPGACTTTPPSYRSDVAPILERRCYGCHAGGGVAAEDHDFSRFATLHAQKDAVAAQVSTCTMPPIDAPPLERGEAEILLRWMSCGAPQN